MRILHNPSHLILFGCNDLVASSRSFAPADPYPSLAWLVGRTPEEAASYVRGPAGSRLRLVVERKGGPEPLVKLITRDTVKLAGVTSSMQSAGAAAIGAVAAARRRSGRTSACRRPTRSGACRGTRSPCSAVCD